MVAAGRTTSRRCRSSQAAFAPEHTSADWAQIGQWGGYHGQRGSSGRCRGPHGSAPTAWHRRGVWWRLGVPPATAITHLRLPWFQRTHRPIGPRSGSGVDPMAREAAPGGATGPMGRHQLPGAAGRPWCPLPTPLTADISRLRLPWLHSTCRLRALCIGHGLAPTAREAAPGGTTGPMGRHQLPGAAGGHGCCRQWLLWLAVACCS